MSPRPLTAARLMSEFDDVPHVEFSVLKPMNLEKRGVNGCRTVGLVEHDGKVFFLKRYDYFSRETLCRELEIYLYLRSQKCQITPKLEALILDNGALSGFLCQELQGEDATDIKSPEERKVALEICREGLKKLHDYGLVHGDITDMINIRIFEGQAVFYDFEKSLMKEDGPHDFEKWCRSDMRRLEMKA